MDRLAAVELRADQRFLDYGLTIEQVDELRQRVTAWVDDIRRRLASGTTSPLGTSTAEPGWDEYLNQ